jgi:RNA polymerase sigma-54 factor
MAALRSNVEARIGRYLVGCLDRRGYFDADIAYAAADLAVSAEDVERVLRVMQTLDPPGIGARSLQECLCIQLQALPASRERTLATQIVSEHLPEIRRQQLGAVATATGASIEDVRAALLFMRRHLVPSPAERFTADQGAQGLRPSEIAVADVLLHRVDDGYRIELNGAAVFALTINPAFKQALVDSRARPTLLSSDERECVRTQVDRARLFIETLRRRNWTLYNCVEYVVTAQRAFLDHGPGHLRPLTMRAIARGLGISESTVSRALDGKFVRLPDGHVTEFGVFLDNAAPAKERIKALIAAEDPARPLTDGRLALELTHEGLAIARRTVAKYRDELRLPQSGRRRRAAPSQS